MPKGKKVPERVENEKSILDKIKDAIASLFGRKVEYYEKVRFPSEEEIPRKLLRENVEARVKELKALEEIEKLKEEIRVLKGSIDEEVKKQLEMQKEMLRRLREEGKFDIYFKTPIPLGIYSALGKENFVGLDGQVYKYLVGIRLLGIKGKTYFKLLVSSDEKGKNVGELRPSIPLRRAIEVVDDPDGLFKNLKFGLIGVNITTDGVFLPKYWKIEEVQPKDGVDLHQILRDVPPDVADLITDFYNRLNIAYQQIEDLNTNLKKATVENTELRSKIQGYEEETQRLKSMIDVYMSKIQTLKDRLSTAEAGLVDAELSKLISTAGIEALEQGIANIQKRLEKRIGKTEREIVMDEMKSVLEAFGKTIAREVVDMFRGEVYAVLGLGKPREEKKEKE